MWQRLLRIILILSVVCVVVITLLRKEDKPQGKEPAKPQGKPIPYRKPIPEYKLTPSDILTDPGSFLEKIKKDVRSFFKRALVKPHFTKEQKAQIDERYAQLLPQMKVELEFLLREYKGLKVRNVHRFPAGNGNAWEYYSKALKMFEDIKLSNEELDFIEGFGNKAADVKKRQKEDPQTYKQIMKKFKEAIELISKGAYQQYVDREEKLEDGFGMPLPHLSQSIRATKIIGEYMNYLIQENRYDEALKLFTDTLSINQALTPSGNLINQLIYIANTSIQSKALEETLNSADFSSQGLVNLAQEIQILDFNKTFSFYDAMRLEYVSSLATISQVADSPEQLGDFFQPIKSTSQDQDEDHPPSDPWYWKNTIIGWYDETKKSLNDIQFIDSLKYTDATRLLDQKAQDAQKSDNLLIQMLTPAVHRAYFEFIAQKAQIALVKTALASKMYLQAYNRFPTSVNDLISAGFSYQMWLDPFTDQPLKINLSDDQKTMKIYSIGANLEDDGGDSNITEDGQHIKDLVFTLTH